MIESQKTALRKEFFMKNTFVKNLSVVLFILSLLVLASCNKTPEEHTHTYGEWKITKEATLNETGAQERTCTCGEKETQSIPSIPSSTGLKYQVNEDGKTCTVTGIGTCKDAKIVIGQTIDNYQVTAIGLDAFFNCQTITEVLIADSVKSIGNSAFANCVALESITLPKEITTIGQAMFSECAALKSIAIPATVTTIANRAFYNCRALESVTLADGLKTIENSAFRNCSALTEIHIPSTVTTLDASAFKNCKKIFDVEDGITYIDTWAMAYDGNATKVTLRDGTVGLIDELFSKNEILVSVTLPDTLKIIGNKAFSECSDLSNLFYHGC